MAKFPGPTLVGYDPDPLREAVRASVTVLTILIFGYVIWFYLDQSHTTGGESWHQVERAMEVILPAVTSVLGTALGFYFGSQKR